MVLKNSWSITLSIFLGYILLLGFFNTIDIYHNYFFSTGSSVIIYNAFRIFFIFCLFWLFYIVGDWILAYTVGITYRQLTTLESVLLAFFAGAGAWHIVLLLVGFAGFYLRSVMVIATLLIFAASLPRLHTWVKHIAAQKSLVYWPGLLIILLPACIFLITNGIYPAGGHDYFNHYFHFYSKVIDSGSILPNEVWYHFYYSKGAGLFFLSMLLTDPLAPQLATTAMIAAGAGMVFLLLQKTTTWRLFPWLGAALYITFLIYTPGPAKNLAQGGWGNLEKLHEPAAVLMLSILWITSGLAHNQSNRMWGITLLLTISSLVLISPTMAVFTGAFLSITTLCFFIRKQIAAAWWAASGTILAGAWLILIETLNYLFTGIPDDQNLLLFWPILNFDKIKEWGVLFEVVWIHWAKTGLIANQVPFTKDILLQIMPYLRIDVWGCLLLATLILFGAALCWHRSRSFILKRLDKTSLAICGGFLLLIALTSFLVGRDQPISFYRFTSFTYAPMLCVCLLLLSSLLHHWITKILFIVLIFFTSWLLITQAYTTNPVLNTVIGRYDITKVKSIIQNSQRFAAGHYSIADAYQNQSDRPGRMPWGGIYPPAAIIWKQLPAKTPIWSMHIHSYCMLPGCNMQGILSFRLSHHAERVFFSSPQIAKAWLKKENFNYFFFSTALQLTDPLPSAPLFSPQYIADYLGIAWTDGENTLLTWKEQARFPIDSAWVDRYARHVHESQTVQSFPYSALKTVLNEKRSDQTFASSSFPWSTS